MGSISWTPSFYLCIHSWLVKINCTFRSFGKLRCIWWHPLLMSTPSKFGRLVKTFRNKSINRPSVPELFCWSDFITFLCIPFSNVNTLDSQVHHKVSPLLSGLRLFFQVVTNLFSNVDYSLLDKPADHSWIGSTAWNCSFLVVKLLALGKHSMSKSIIGSIPNG